MSTSPAIGQGEERVVAIGAPLGASSRRWARARTALVPGFVVAFLAVQLLVPLAQLLAPGPARFGWQMFASSPDSPRFWSVGPDGVASEVAIADHVAHLRYELDYVPALPEYLCRTLPGVVAVRYEVGRDAGQETFACP